MTPLLLPIYASLFKAVFFLGLQNDLYFSVQQPAGIIKKQEIMSLKRQEAETIHQGSHSRD